MNEFRLDLALDLSALQRALDNDDRDDDQRAQARGLAKGVYIKALLDEDDVPGGDDYLATVERNVVLDAREFVRGVRLGGPGVEWAPLPDASDDATLDGQLLVVVEAPRPPRTRRC